jgi:hypothetical protein
VFSQPAYQKDAVDEFFRISKEGDLPPPGMFSRNGRAYPDVSLLGNRFIEIKRLGPVGNMLFPFG